MHRILIVEDDEGTTLLIKRSIGSEYAVTTCSTLKNAREELQRTRFDLILLDIGLPDGDGFQFMATLKNLPEHCDIPVFFLTTKSSVSDQVMGISLGAEDFLIKP